MFPQTGPAETTNYMILGFAVIFGVVFIYLASFTLRARNLRSDLELLQIPKRKATRHSVRKSKS